MNLHDAIFKIKNLWNPGFFIEKAYIKHLGWFLSEISIYLIIFFTVLEISRQIYANASNGEEFKLDKPFIKICVFTLFTLHGLFYSNSFDMFLVKPVMAITNKINTTFDITHKVDTDIRNLDSNVEKSVVAGGQLFDSIDKQTPLGIVASICFFLGIIGLYIISLIQQLYLTILFIVGPIIIPTFIFEPFSDMFMAWLKKCISVLSWAIFGSIVVKLIFICGIFPGLSNAVGNNNSINISILALSMAILCWFIPSLANQIVGSTLDAGLSVTGMAGMAASGGGSLLKKFKGK